MDNCFFLDNFLVGHFSDWPLNWWTLMNFDEHHGDLVNRKIETISMIFAMSDFCEDCIVLWGLFFARRWLFLDRNAWRLKYRDSLVFWIINSVEIYLSQDPPRGVLFWEASQALIYSVWFFRTRGGEYALNEDVLTWLVSDAPNNRFCPWTTRFLITIQ